MEWGACQAVHAGGTFERKRWGLLSGPISPSTTRIISIGSPVLKARNLGRASLSKMCRAIAYVCHKTVNLLRVEASLGNWMGI